MKKYFRNCLLCLIVCLISITATAQDKVEMSVQLESRGAIYRAIKYLINNQQKDGSWHKHPGITAFCLLALNQSQSGGKTVPKEVMDKGLNYLRQQINQDGSLKNSKQQTDIYSTSVCLLTLSKLNNAEDKQHIANMNSYLMKTQSNLSAFHYSKSDYPDLSNTHWAMEAIYISAADPKDKQMMSFWHKASKFISSCQVEESKRNSELGGFTYYPQGKKPEKVDGDAPETVFGSLTMGALKSLLYAQVKADDPRMNKGLKWISNNYSVKENPGLKDGGYYYYLYMFSSLMLIWDKDFIHSEDAKHNWRDDILQTLLSKQKSDGNWVNQSKLWREDNSSLCTAYAILSMEFCLVK